MNKIILHALGLLVSITDQKGELDIFCRTCGWVHVIVDINEIEIVEDTNKDPWHLEKGAPITAQHECTGSKHKDVREMFSKFMLGTHIKPLESKKGQQEEV